MAREAAKSASLLPGLLAHPLRSTWLMSCHRCLRWTPEDVDPTTPAPADGACEGHPPTALETLCQAVRARSIQSVHVASEDPAESPIRAAWIIS